MLLNDQYFVHTFERFVTAADFFLQLPIFFVAALNYPEALAAVQLVGALRFYRQPLRSAMLLRVRRTLEFHEIV